MLVEPFAGIFNNIITDITSITTYIRGCEFIISHNVGGTLTLAQLDNLYECKFNITNNVRYVLNHPTDPVEYISAQRNIFSFGKDIIEKEMTENSNTFEYDYLDPGDILPDDNITPVYDLGTKTLTIPRRAQFAGKIRFGGFTTISNPIHKIHYEIAAPFFMKNAHYHPISLVPGSMINSVGSQLRIESTGGGTDGEIALEGNLTTNFSGSDGFSNDGAQEEIKLKLNKGPSSLYHTQVSKIKFT